MSVYVEKIRVPVRLSQPNLDPRDGCFLLFPRQGDENRPETLVELLNSERLVVPFILSGDSTVLLLSRKNIDWVMVSPSVEMGLVLPPGLEWNRTQRAELRFMDEARVEAMLGWSTERTAQRLSDHLNCCDRFVASLASFGTLIWNKHRIREVRILEAKSATNPPSSGARAA